MRTRHLSVPICLLLWSGAVNAADSLLWPADGDFPGYPAEPSDGKNWHMAIIGGILHDDNLFRLPNNPNGSTGLGTQRSDSIYQLGVGLNTDIAISQQHLILKAEADRYQFDEFNFLNYTGHNVDLKWKWLIGDLWNGNLGYGHRRYLTSFAVLQAPVRDLIDESHAYFTTMHVLSARWRLQAGADVYDFQHSDSSQKDLDNKIVSGALGLLYMTPAQNSLGVRAKWSQGDYPNRELVSTQLIDNQYQEQEVSGVVDWQLTGISKLDGRVGFTHRQHDQVPARDFSGVTYLLGLRWAPLGSTVFRVSALRDLQSYTDASASYILVQGAHANVAWAPSYHAVLQLALKYEDWQFRGDPSIALTSVTSLRQDIVHAGEIIAGYMPTRDTRLEIAFTRSLRDSNYSGVAYDDNVIEGRIKIGL